MPALTTFAMPLLKDITSIRSGYLFQGGVKPAPEGQYSVAQLSDISTDGLLTNTLTCVSLPDLKPAHLIEKGDILFASRGTRKRAVSVAEPIPNLIATSQFLILHLNDSSILPEYLAWYLNQKPAQRFIEEHSGGSSVSLINRNELGELPVHIPPLDHQRRIIQIHALYLREKQLMNQIQEKRQLLIENLLLKTIEQVESEK